MRKLRRFVRFGLLAIPLLLPVRVLAQSSSSNYSVQESSFSSGSQLDASSASYSARVSAGDVAIGFSESGSFLAFAGPISPDEEYVELVVPSTTVDFGVLSPGAPGTGTATFSARAYLNDSYSIYTLEEPPSIGGGAPITAITSAAASTPNTEQFGINLVANTDPAVQGADPSRLPVDNGFFAFGQAATGYNTADVYQYNSGDPIAESTTRGYGETDYTISYIMNISNITPAGLYTMEQNLVITGTF